eukprot:TRINITY_DN12244_c0_g1_i1.p1 TRINITY_DN12244_c0_g1~~TRINITY_DN12244_c0_g1_i1.p1  ORF type:complete len:1601 (-),score=291.30 TRINITY_DN12244_c0_g1_i1:54-4856(-)
MAWVSGGISRGVGLVGQGVPPKKDLGEQFAPMGQSSASYNVGGSDGIVGASGGRHGIDGGGCDRGVAKTSDRGTIGANVDCASGTHSHGVTNGFRGSHRVRCGSGASGNARSGSGDGGSTRMHLHKAVSQGVRRCESSPLGSLIVAPRASVLTPETTDATDICHLRDNSGTVVSGSTACFQPFGDGSVGERVPGDTDSAANVGMRHGSLGNLGCGGSVAARVVDDEKRVFPAPVPSSARSTRQSAGGLASRFAVDFTRDGVASGGGGEGSSRGNGGALFAGSVQRWLQHTVPAEASPRLPPRQTPPRSARMLPVSSRSNSGGGYRLTTHLGDELREKLGTVASVVGGTVSTAAQTPGEPEPEHFGVTEEEADEIAAALFGCVSRVPRNGCAQQREASIRVTGSARDELGGCGSCAGVGVSGSSINSVGISGSARSGARLVDSQGGALDPEFMAALLDAESEQAAVGLQSTPPLRRPMTPTAVASSTRSASAGITATSSTSLIGGRLAVSGFRGSVGGDGCDPKVGVSNTMSGDGVVGNCRADVSSVGQSGDSVGSIVTRRSSSFCASAAASLLAAEAESAVVVTATEPVSNRRKEEHPVRAGALFIHPAACGTNQTSLAQSPSELEFVNNMSTRMSAQPLRTVPVSAKVVNPVPVEAADPVPVEAASLPASETGDVCQGDCQSGEGDESDGNDCGCRGGNCDTSAVAHTAASEPSIIAATQQGASVFEKGVSRQPWDRLSPLTCSGGTGEASGSAEPFVHSIGSKRVGGESCDGNRLDGRLGSKGSRSSDDADASSSKPNRSMDIVGAFAVVSDTRSVVAPSVESSNSCSIERNSGGGDGGGGSSSSSSSSSSSGKSSPSNGGRRCSSSGSSSRWSPASARSFRSSSAIDCEDGEGDSWAGSALWKDSDGQGERKSLFIRSPSVDVTSALLSCSSDGTPGDGECSGGEGMSPWRGAQPRTRERGKLHCDEGHGKEKTGGVTQQPFLQPATAAAHRLGGERGSRKPAAELVREQSPIAKEGSRLDQSPMIVTDTPAAKTSSGRLASTTAPSATTLAEWFARGGSSKSRNKMTLRTTLDSSEQRDAVAAADVTSGAQSPPSTASPAERLYQAPGSWLEQGLSLGRADPHDTSANQATDEVSTACADGISSVGVGSSIAVETNTSGATLTADPYGDVFVGSTTESPAFDSFFTASRKNQEKDEEEMDGPLLGAASMLGDTLRNMAVAVAHVDAILWRVGDEHPPKKSDGDGSGCSGGDVAESSGGAKMPGGGGEIGADASDATGKACAAHGESISRESPAQAAAPTTSEGSSRCGGDKSPRDHGVSSSGYTGDYCYDSVRGSRGCDSARSGYNGDTPRGKRPWPRPPITPLTPASLSNVSPLSFSHMSSQPSSRHALWTSSRPQSRQPSRPTSPTGSVRSTGSNDTSLSSMPRRGSITSTTKRTRDAVRGTMASHHEHGMEDLNIVPPSPNPSVMSLPVTPGNAAVIEQRRTRRSSSFASGAAAWAAPPRIDEEEVLPSSSRHSRRASSGQLSSSRASGSFSSNSAGASVSAAKTSRRRQSLGEPSPAAVSQSQECALCGASGCFEPGAVFCQSCSSRMDDLG